jgi:hypothetical protein
MYFGTLTLSTDIDRGTNPSNKISQVCVSCWGARVKFSTHFSLSDYITLTIRKND